MVARKTATAHATMIDLVRGEVRDPLLDRAGNTVSQTRHSSTDVESAIRWAQMFLQRDLGLVDSSTGRTYTDGTYTAGAFSVAIPGASAFDPILKLENIDDLQRPLMIPSLPFEEIERYSLSTNVLPTLPRGLPYRCCLIDGTTDGTRHVIIRPRPTGALAIRAWRLGGPLVYSTGDTHDLAVHWEDLIVLLAAQTLLGRLEDMSTSQRDRLIMCKDQFRSYANRRRQTQRIRRERSGRS